MNFRRVPPTLKGTIFVLLSLVSTMVFMRVMAYVLGAR